MDGQGDGMNRENREVCLQVVSFHFISKTIWGRPWFKAHSFRNGNCCEWRASWTADLIQFLPLFFLFISHVVMMPELQPFHPKVRIINWKKRIGHSKSVLTPFIFAVSNSLLRLCCIVHVFWVVLFPFLPPFRPPLPNRIRHGGN